MTVSLALLLTLGVAPTLSGCSTSGDEGATPPSSAASGADVSVNGALPAGWPSEVPVIDGTILMGVGNASEGRWVVTITSAAADPLGTARTQLEDAGFSSDKSVAASGTGAVTLSDEAYSVVIVSNAEGIVYTVTKR